MGTGQKVKSTMRLPGLSTLGENEPTTSWAAITGKNSSQAPSVVKQDRALTNQFGQMNIGKKAMDPSNAPGTSQLSVQYKPNRSQMPTQLTLRDDKGKKAQWVRTEFCVRSPYNRRSFTRGMIITLPFHVANLNEKATYDDKCLASTLHGPVYSKRRMAVVLWRHDTDMICLPLYSWNSVGISKQPEWLQHEYMEITNLGEAASYRREGPHEVLEAKMVRPLDRKGCVHASGTFRVSYQEDIALVGQLTQESRSKLTDLVNKLVERTQTENY